MSKDLQLMQACQKHYEELKLNNPELFNVQLDRSIINTLQTNEHIRICVLLKNSGLKRMFMSRDFVQWIALISEKVSMDVLFINAFEIENNK